MQQRSRILWKVAVIGWASFFTILLLIPPPDLGGEAMFPHRDKLMHMAVFGFWTLLMLMAERAHGRRQKYLLVGAIGVVYAPITELLQSYTPNRTADLWDVMADIAGVLISIYVFHWLYPRLFSKEHTKR